MDYRNDLEASRLRITTLEAKLEESDAALKARDAELAECKSERDRLRKTGKTGPTRSVWIALIVGAFFLGAGIGAGFGLTISRSSPQNVAEGAVEAPEEPQEQGPSTDSKAYGRAPIVRAEPTPSSAIVVGQAGDASEERASIQSITDAARSDVRACYQKEIEKHPEASGSLNVVFDIEPTGKVSRVELSAMLATSPHWWSKDFDACVVKVFRKQEFPAASAKTTAKGSYFFSALDRHL